MKKIPFGLLKNKWEKSIIIVPSRTSGTKQIMVVEALAVVEALETTVMSKELIVMCS